MYLFSECFGNSHFYVQKKSSDDCHGVSANLKYLTSCYYIFNPVLFIISFEGSPFGSKESMPVSYQNSQTSKEIGLDISIFVGSSVLYWHIVKQSSIFVTASILNLRFFVWVFSKIVDYVAFLHAVMVYYVQLVGYINNELLCFKKCQHEFFSSTSPSQPQDTYINDKLLAGMDH